jgi:hypothetical protein
MLLRAAQRLIGMVIFAFAVLGFVSVPIFDDTGLGHAKRLLGSSEADMLKTQLEEWAKKRGLTDEKKQKALSHRHERRAHIAP